MIWHCKSDQEPASQQCDIRIGGLKCLINVSPVMSLLLDGEAGQCYQILHSAKVYVRKPISELAAASPFASLTNSPVSTGRSQVISNFTAWEYLATNSTASQAVWVVKDYPDWPKIREQLAQAPLKELALLGYQVVNNQLPGLVVRMESSGLISFSGITNVPIPAPSFTNVLNLVSVTIVPDDPELLKVPEGYEEVEELFPNPVAEEIKHAGTRPPSLGSFVIDTNINMPDLSVTGVMTARSNRAAAWKNLPSLQTNQVRVVRWGTKGEEDHIETLSPTNQVMLEYASAARTNSMGPRFVRPPDSAPASMRSNGLFRLPVPGTNSPVMLQLQPPLLRASSLSNSPAKSEPAKVP
jgi:hypothetical protein